MAGSCFCFLGTLRFPVESPHFFGLEPDETNSETFPLMTFVAYQGAVAVFAPAMISGAVVGRMKLIPYMIFIFLWTTCCYDPLTRWSMYSKGNVSAWKEGSRQTSLLFKVGLKFTPLWILVVGIRCILPAVLVA